MRLAASLSLLLGTSSCDGATVESAGTSRVADAGHAREDGRDSDRSEVQEARREEDLRAGDFWTPYEMERMRSGLRTPEERWRSSGGTSPELP